MKKCFAFLFFVTILTLQANSQIVISEIMYNPPESGNDSLEYIEFANLSDAPYSLAGHAISVGVVDTFEPGEFIPANGYFVTAINSAAFLKVFGFTVHQWKSGALSNSGEAITLVDGSGAVVATATYSKDSNGWPASPDGDGPSLEMCDLTADPTIGSNWGPSLTATGIEINGKEIFATPGQPNSATCGPATAAATVEVTDFEFTPAEVTIKEGETVKWVFVSGHHNVNGNQSIYPNNPASFRSGDPAIAPFEYEFTFNVPGKYDYTCDAHLFMLGVVNVTPRNPVITYPVRTIGQVNSTDANGVADSLGKTCEVRGIVYGVNMRTSGISTTIIDGNRDGIGLFSGGLTFGLTVTEGDEVVVRGKVDQFNGLTQITIDTMWRVSSGNALFPARLVTELGEDTESDLVLLENYSLKDPSEWKKGTSFNATITNGTNEIVLRVVNTTTLADQDAPNASFNLIGLGGQFDNSNPFTEGYQILPRYAEDLYQPGNVNSPLVSSKIMTYPNPAGDVLHVESSLQILQVQVMDAFGNKLMTVSGNINKVTTAHLPAGSYYLWVKTNEGGGVKSFIKQ